MCTQQYLAWTVAEAGPSGKGDAKVSQPRLAVGVERRYYYKDDSGAVRGPFSEEQMRQWHVQGLLPSRLMIRVAGTEGDFVPITQSPILAAVERYRAQHGSQGYDLE